MDAQFCESASSQQQQPNSNKDNIPELFARHSDTVLCCSIDNNARLAVSGGIDDTAFVWDLNTKHVIFECIGHKESVVAASFSANSTYVATGDLNGYIQVRNTTTGIRIFDYEIDEINWILWHNVSEFVLLAGTTKGDFWMWNVNDPAALKTFPSYGASSTSARLMNHGMKIVVTYQDGFVRIFDLKTKQALFQMNQSGNQEIICMDLNHTQTLLAIGCIDSSVKLITTENCKVIGTLGCKSPEKPVNSSDPFNKLKQDDKHLDQGRSTQASVNSEDNGKDDPDDIPPDSAEPFEVIDEYSAMNQTNDDLNDDADDIEDDIDEDYEGDETADLNSIESVSFSPCGTLLVASNNSGSTIIWDVSTLKARCELHTGVGITRSAWTDDGNYITGCLDGSVRVYDINLNNLSSLQAHHDQILDLALKGRVLVTASEDKTCRVIDLRSLTQ